MNEIQGERDDGTITKLQKADGMASGRVGERLHYEWMRM